MPGQPIAPTDLFPEKNDTVKPQEERLLLYGTVPHNGSIQKNSFDIKNSSLDSSERILWLESAFIIPFIISSDFKSACVTRPASNLFHFSRFLKSFSF